MISSLARLYCLISSRGRAQLVATFQSMPDFVEFSCLVRGFSSNLINKPWECSVWYGHFCTFVDQISSLAFSSQIRNLKVHFHFQYFSSIPFSLSFEFGCCGARIDIVCECESDRILLVSMFVEESALGRRAHLQDIINSCLLTLLIGDRASSFIHVEVFLFEYIRSLSIMDYWL